jgi:parvulin-like peptidyl-prolyl isomerase
MKEKLRVTRTPRLLAVAGVAALVLTGCGDGTVRTGAAATVGGDRITTTALDNVVTRGLADPSAQQTVGADRPTFERAVLRRLIDHLLLDRAAAREGVTISGADVLAAHDQIATQLGGEAALTAEALKAGISAKDLDQTLSDIALRDALADKLTASIDVPQAALLQAYNQNIAQYDQVRSAHILVAAKSQADQILATVKADPAQFSALAAKFSTDPGSKDKGGDLGFLGRGALEKSFETAIFTNPPGSFVIVKTQYGFHVIHVIARKTTTLQQAKTSLRRTLLGQQRSTAVTALLLKTAKELGVHVNPRFGAWDAKTQEVVALNSGPGSVTRTSPQPGDAASPQASTGP